MSPAAATGIRSKAHKNGRPSGSRSNSGMPQGNGAAVGEDADANEHTSLLSRPFQTSNGPKPWEDSRRYIRWPAIVGHTTWEVLISNYVNVLLVFVPLGIVAGLVHWNPTVIFILNFLAIVPLASLLSFATEELSLKLGQTLGGLLNASFGNAVELIVGATQVIDDERLIIAGRSASSHSIEAKFESFSRACLAPSSPTSSLF